MKLTKLLSIESPVPDANTVIFNVDHLLFGSSNKIHIKLIQSNEKFVRLKADQGNQFSCVGVSANRVVTGTTQGNLLFHQISNQGIKTSRKAHHGQVNAMAVNGSYVLSGGRDKTVKLWSLKGKDKPLHVFAGHRNWVTSVDFGHGEADQHPNRVVSGGLDKVVKLWDIETGKHWQSISLDSEVKAVKFDHHRRTICASTNEFLLIIDPFNDKITQCYPIPGPATKIMHFKNIVMTGHDGLPMQAFDVTKGQRIEVPALKGKNYCQFQEYIAMLCGNQCSMYQLKEH